MTGQKRLAPGDSQYDHFSDSHGPPKKTRTGNRNTRARARQSAADISSDTALERALESDQPASIHSARHLPSPLVTRLPWELWLMIFDRVSDARHDMAYHC